MRRAFPLAIMICASCTHPHAKPSVAARPFLGSSTIVDDPSTPPLTLSGVVMSDSTNAALAYANVCVLHHCSAAGGMPGAFALTDAQGHFSITAPDSGVTTVYVKLIGYRSIHREIRFDATHGLVATFRLAVNTLTLCSLIITYPHSVAVRLRDAVTGLPITSNASLEVIDGKYHDRVVSGGPPPQGVNDPDPGLLVAGTRAGTFDVIVRLPRYKEWRAHHVVAKFDGCAVETAGLTAQLMSRK